jgi:hypothetical protein
MLEEDKRISVIIHGGDSKYGNEEELKWLFALLVGILTISVI